MASYQFSVLLSNCDKRITCSGLKSLLHSMQDLGVKSIPVGCRSGGCGVCKIKIHQGQYRVIGKMSRSCISVEDEAQGEVLACRIIPASDLDISVIGKMQRSIINL